ncbi:hypothetical protein M0L20_21985 [Spirosoma sp. RP8]|uniref:Secreted protein n=1 Tax=Spirosoma liriopis TaxID=2937440 RepID=A0ABT0HSQ5_9BACT|nr:hypothetical protein [Spirosoma liriopis]MCK8494555.1 hypothetical protein [Spirosoma liriopis]
MKRLLLLTCFSVLFSCKPSSVGKLCYSCTVYTTDNPQSTIITQELCGQSEMEQYVEDMRAKPGTGLIYCVNK